MPTPEFGATPSDDQAEGHINGMLVNHGRIAGIAIAVSLSVIFALAAWHALHEAGSNNSMVAEIPLIKADPGPVKVKPKDPGGLKIPNQDKLVFERITPENRHTFEEKLAPEPEEPIVIPQATNRKVKSTNSDNSSISMTGENLTPIRTSPFGITPSHDKAAIVYKIQLAAFRNEDQAKANWEKIIITHAEILSTLTPLMEKVDLGKKGVYFRVQAGYFNVINSARNICAKLKAKGQSCIIVHPK